ncbi:tetraspanin-3-like isoform X2 [Mixophyes fleayi]|uniref:tetraspanin-3-like isoform X2 n=1 Tax=Mixophyes fleayi TaxID=3061075 RepID=UPI003F4E2116
MFSEYRHLCGIDDLQAIPLKAIVVLLAALAGRQHRTAAVSRTTFQFMYFIVVLLCLLSTGLVLAYVYINRMDHELRPMLNAFQQYNDSNYGIVNKIQNELHCCGLQNYTDWETTSWYKRSDNHSVPKSCCNVAFSACFGILTESNKLYQEGCFVKLHHKLTFFLIWLFWSGITIICVEILAAVFDGILMTRNPFQDFRILDSGVFA